MKKLEELVSESCYDEITDKLKEKLEDAYDAISPFIFSCIVDGDGDMRKTILSDWLHCDTCRVCECCGAIMEEGWYDEIWGYDCSDSCAAKRREMTSEEFERYRIYKEDVACKAKEDGKSLEDLTKEEVEDYIDAIVGSSQSCWTTWY